MTKNILTQAELKEQLNYNPESGLFTWKVANSKRVKIGETAGTITDKGYIRITLNKKGYKAHRLAWLFIKGEMPSGDIDHINGIKADNCICNLRLCSRVENMQNIGKTQKNTSGYKGAFLTKDNRWISQAKLNGTVHYLGSFDTPEEASFAYNNFAKLHHGSFYKPTI
jgi:hypothetical protein